MAKVFKFRLERLLEVRKLREDIARQETAKAVQAVREQNENLMRTLREDQEGKDALRALKQKEMDLVQIRLQEGYLGSLERKIRREFGHLQELTHAEAEARRALTEARKKVRVLERLRERQHTAYRYDLDREEQKVLDEVGQRMRRLIS